VNWVLVEDDDELTLIDTGYPRDARKLEASLARIGRHPADVSAVLVAGDAVMTGHAVVAAAGPQLLPPMFNTDHAQARASLRLLEPIPARVVVVGHGPAFYGSPRELVQHVPA
jgi:glyoxylase-like metal-dependent hydrolase (beta-lactamase superfamily II)